MLTKAFTVAKHTFTLQLPDNFWNKIENYDPFKTSIFEKDLLFSLTYVEQMDVVDKQLVVIDATEPDMPRIEVYKTQNGWCFEMSERRDSEICFKILTNLDFTEGQFSLLDTSKHLRFATDNAAMLMYAFGSAHKDTLEMHASVIKKDGFGYLFLGKSGTGKSTHSRLWLENIKDTELLNDDNPIVRIIDGKAWVFGSPWSGKTPCYKNDAAPIKAIIALKQAKQNEIIEHRPVEAYAAVYTSTSGLKTDPSKADALHHTIVKLIGQVKCCRLNCLPNAEAALCCYQFAQ